MIKRKRGGEIKERICTDGSRQRQYLKEGENVASPTIFMEALFLTFLITAY